MWAGGQFVVLGQNFFKKYNNEKGKHSGHLRYNSISHCSHPLAFQDKVLLSSFGSIIYLISGGKLSSG